MTDTVDKIMALAEMYRRAQIGEIFNTNEALRAAVVEALDLGEPVAWRREWDGDVSDEGSWIYDETQSDDSPNWTALYARSKT